MPSVFFFMIVIYWECLVLFGEGGTVKDWCSSGKVILLRRLTSNNRRWRLESFELFLLHTCIAHQLCQSIPNGF